MKTWVVVADGSRARIFVQEKRGGELSEVEDMVHPDARLRQGELASSRLGSGHGALGAGRHAMNDPTPMHEHEADLFARELGRRLEAAHAHGDFQKLALVAPPKFLGSLRAQLGEALWQHVIAEIHHDLVKHSPAEVLEHLRQAD